MLMSCVAFCIFLALLLIEKFRPRAGIDHPSSRISTIAEFGPQPSMHVIGINDTKISLIFDARGISSGITAGLTARGDNQLSGVQLLPEVCARTVQRALRLATA